MLMPVYPSITNTSPNPWALQTPVVLLIFNRPETTRRVFAAIRQARPPKLLLIADGARPDRPQDAERCAQVRAIVEQVDWDCEVLTNYADRNLGCGRRVVSGLDWVFEQVEEAIVLEDDCLPHPSFFRFCEELLGRYRQDTRIMHITGTNLQLHPVTTPYSYGFSAFPHGCGWASWRRAWRHFDPNLQLWRENRNPDWIRAYFREERIVRFWSQMWDDVCAGGDEHIWDYQWTFACWVQNGLSIFSSTNLITNIGFGADATHTTTPSHKSPFADRPAAPLAFPLRHPPTVTRNWVGDQQIQRTFYDLDRWIRWQWRWQRLWQW